MANRYAIVAGEFTPWGGMDRPNYELAWYLAERRGAEVHLISHRVASPLCDHGNVTWHRVPRPLGRHALGEPFLGRTGWKVSREIAGAGGTVVVNGGNCLWNDVNWVHYTHDGTANEAARPPFLYGHWLRWKRWYDHHRECRALGGARLIIADSAMIKERLIRGFAVDPGLVRTIYYGIDPDMFRPVGPAERIEARRVLGLPADRPLMVFIGGLGRDRRKGFDVLFDAWCRCCARAGWDAVLVVAGAGPELPYWERRAAEAGRGDAIRLLGFTRSVPTILAAADALVSPTRFEPYGQGVHEAICCGIPAFVTRCAGISERYPPELHDLLLDAPPESAQLCERLQEWRRDIDGYRRRMIPFAESLRRRTWSDMAAEFVAAVEEGQS